MIRSKRKLLVKQSITYISSRLALVRRHLLRDEIMYTIEKHADNDYAAVYDERDALIICEASTERRAERMLLDELNKQGIDYGRIRVI